MLPHATRDTQPDTRHGAAGTSPFAIYTTKTETSAHWPPFYFFAMAVTSQPVSGSTWISRVSFSRV